MLEKKNKNENPSQEIRRKVDKRTLREEEEKAEINKTETNTED